MRPLATLLLLLVLAFAVLTPAPVRAFQQPSLSIGAGSVTGAYYVAGSAVAKVFNRRSPEYGVRLTTVPSEGSRANIDSVLLGKTAFGIAQADVLRRAAEGLEPWEGRPQNGLRSVLGLQVEAVTIVAARDRGIQRVSDLAGKRVNIGAPGSSDHAYAALLLEAAAVSAPAVTLFERSSALASELLQRDEIDAYIYTVGHPSLSLLDASTGERKVRLVPLDEPLIERVAARNPLLRPAAIATDYYPSLAAEGTVPTIGVRAVLFTRADAAEETVYRLVRDVLANFDLFRRQHPLLQPLVPTDVCGRMPIPVHPGAERACREAGVTP